MFKKIKDVRGTFNDGYKFAREGGKPSSIKDKHGDMIGYRQGPWLQGFRQAHIDMTQEMKKKGVIRMPMRFKLTTVGWS